MARSAATQDYDDPMPTPPLRAAAIEDHGAFWSRSPEQLYAALQSSAQGLTTAEAERRLREHGANVLDEEPAAGVGRLALRQFKSPLVLILVFAAAGLGCAARLAGRGHHPGRGAGQRLLGFAQEYRASTAVAQLRRRLALTATVCATAQPRRCRRASLCQATSCSCRPAT